MKGTGGGPGDPANYSCWHQREEWTIARYNQHLNNLYLTIIYMWDKEFSYPLVIMKDVLPTDCQIQDEPDNEFDTNSFRSPILGKGMFAKEDQLLEAIKLSSLERERSTTKVKDLIESFVAEGSNNSLDDVKSMKQTELINSISTTVS